MTKKIEVNDGPTHEGYEHGTGNGSLTTNEAILYARRIDALSSCDTPVYSYHRYSMLRDFQQCRGRNADMIVTPLLLLLLWGICWQLIFIYADDDDNLKDTIGSWGALINPLWIPISFLMVFRLARAAVRFWDSRAAMGKIIQTCRDTVSTASVALKAPHRLAMTEELGKGVESEVHNIYEKHVELLDKYARWVCAFPIAVKNYLRPRMDTKIKCTRSDQLLNEIGFLLDDNEARMLLEAKHPVLLVLDQLRELAYDICFTVDINLHPTATAEINKQMNTHLDSLSGAFGAMERICGTPLPFVYVTHLRTFLLLYLLLFNLYSVAHYGWEALLILVAANWAMLGLEAASVECERPFGLSPNHLPLGKFCIIIAENIVQTLDETKPAFDH